MSIRKLITLGIVLALVGGSVATFWLLQDDESNKQDTNIEIVKNNKVGLIIEKDASLVRKTSEPASQLWEFSQPRGNRQEFVIDANYEQGASLKKLTGYTKQSLRDSVVANVNIQLPKQYPEYKEMTQRNLTVNGYEANETVFEYSTSGVRVKQRLLLLFKNSETAVYIRGQAKADEYAGINKKYFEPIFSSAKFE